MLFKNSRFLGCTDGTEQPLKNKLKEINAVIRVSFTGKAALAPPPLAPLDARDEAYVARKKKHASRAKAHQHLYTRVYSLEYRPYHTPAAGSDLLDGRHGLLSTGLLGKLVDNIPVISPRRESYPRT